MKPPIQRTSLLPSFISLIKEMIITGIQVGILLAFVAYAIAGIIDRLPVVK